jgi:hypothetical protein
MRDSMEPWPGVCGSDVNSFCCHGLVLHSEFLVVFEKPNRSSFAFTFTHPTPPLCRLSVWLLQDLVMAFEMIIFALMFLKAFSYLGM